MSLQSFHFFFYWNVDFLRNFPAVLTRLCNVFLCASLRRADCSDVQIHKIHVEISEPLEVPLEVPFHFSVQESLPVQEASLQVWTRTSGVKALLGAVRSGAEDATISLDQTVWIYLKDIHTLILENFYKLRMIPIVVKKLVASASRSTQFLRMLCNF